MSEIPISSALSETDPNSLQELWSRDPEGYSQQDLDTIISQLRALREKMETTPSGRIRQARPRAATTTTRIIDDGSNPEDYGI